LSGIYLVIYHAKHGLNQSLLLSIWAICYQFCVKQRWKSHLSS